MARYSKNTKDKIKALLDAGIPIGEVQEEEGVPRNTIWRWKKEWDKENQDSKATLANLKKQLSNLSKRKMTEAVSRKIAMISNAIGTLQRVEEKRKEAAKKSKEKLLITVDTNDQYDSYLKKVLQEKWLFKYQEEFLLDKSQFRTVLKSRQIGFSYVAALDALLAATTGRNQLFLSASEEQALILMRYVEMWAERLGITFSGKDTDHEKHLSNGAIIKALANNFRTVQGFTGDIWMDEFAWYTKPKRIWLAFVPSIGAVKGRLTIMSTPFEEASLFHAISTDETKYYMFSRHRVDIYRAVQDGLEFDLETMRDLFDADTWASAYECQFIDDEAAMFPISLIKSCVDPNFSYYTPHTNAILFSGYDIGRTKDRSCKTALEMRKGVYDLAIKDLIVKAPFAAQEALISSYLHAYALSQMRIDQTGIGLQLAENMHAKFKRRAVGVTFTQTSKSIMVKNLKKLFEDKKIRIPNDQMLIADIHSIKRIAGQKDFKYDSDRNEHGHADSFWSLALSASHVEALVGTKSSGGKAWIL